MASHGGHAFSSVVIVDGLMGRGVLVNNWEKLSFEEEKDSGDALSKLNRLEMKRVVWGSVWQWGSIVGGLQEKTMVVKTRNSFLG